MREQLEGIDGWITFEYGIPNLNKVVDVILLTAGKIFVIEFKTGSKTHTKDAIKQVEGYAYRLKYYHSGSNDKWVIPILVATDAELKENNPHKELAKLEDMVYPVIKCN